MPGVAHRRTRKLRIIAQDPSVTLGGRIVTMQVDVPSEVLSPGPRGYRVAVVDYDSSERALYGGVDLGGDETAPDRYAKTKDAVLLSDPGFHAQNVYAIVMRTLARFEFALGRRVPWGFYGHQIHVAPHAFADANAFYAESAHGLFFGYYPTSNQKNTVFTCLSHDVVAHETTHAILDGLRDLYTDASLPDQAAFHEGFGDIVALLSVFSLRDLVEAVLKKQRKDIKNGRVKARTLSAAWLKESALLGLAEQMGQEPGPGEPRREALRRSVKLEPDPKALLAEEYQEPHRRGEILVAAVMNAFASVWESRLRDFGTGYVPLRRVWEEGAEAAEHLLTMAIRALDYCPPLDLSFGDYFSALLTADHRLVTDDSRFGYRKRLRDNFKAWGIDPSSHDADAVEPGTWAGPEGELRYDRVHFEALQRDEEEVFRFLWENRDALKVFDDAFTKVISVRPCVRIHPDGFALRETVAEYSQTVNIKARELPGFGLTRPEDMPAEQGILLRGGGTLIFDEFGILKFHVRKRLTSRKRQQDKIDYLWQNQMLDADGQLGLQDGVPTSERFASLHRLRTGYFRRF